jgi:hypothetical protein
MCRIALSNTTRLSKSKFGFNELFRRQAIYGISEALALLESPAQKRKDFTDTAALIAELDLVISVNAVAANLAGALGKPKRSIVFPGR